MTPSTAASVPRVFRLDGRKIASAKDFYREIGRSVNGRGGYFGTNLDALADCLRGGFGTPEDRPFAFEWRHSESSRRRLADVQENAFVDAVREVFDDVGVTLTLS